MVNGGIFVLSLMLGVFGPIILGAFVGRFITVRGKWSDRFSQWPIMSLLLIPPIAVGTIIDLLVVKHDIGDMATILTACYGIIATILFAAGFMRWCKKI